MWGRIKFLNSNLTKFKRWIWSNIVEFDWILLNLFQKSRFRPKTSLKLLNLPKFRVRFCQILRSTLVEFDHKSRIWPKPTFEFKIWNSKNWNSNELEQIPPSLALTSSRYNLFFRFTFENQRFLLPIKWSKKSRQWWNQFLHKLLKRS